MEQLTFYKKENYIYSFIAKLKITYPVYFNKLEDIELASMYKIYEKELKNYSADILDEVFNKIINGNSFMPSLNEIKIYCKEAEKEQSFLIIEKMKDDGYFKKEQEYDKILMWLEKGIIPSWFKSDMENYKKLEVYNEKSNNL